MQIWTELRVAVPAHPDAALLLDVIAPLVDALRPRLERWHYLWEPDLWVRLRWKAPDDRDAGEAEIREALDAARDAGALERWWFDTYEHQADAEMMGREMGPTFQRDIEHCAEMGLELVRRTRDGSLSKDIDFHWARHMHVFSNQLVGTWADEARLCVEQARYRAWLLSLGKPAAEHHEALRAIVEQLDAVLAEVERLARAEDAILDEWRAQDRPDITELLELPEDFSRRPADNP